MSNSKKNYNTNKQSTLSSNKMDSSMCIEKTLGSDHSKLPDYSSIGAVNNFSNIITNSLKMKSSPILSTSSSLTALTDSLKLESSSILSASNSLTSLVDSLKMKPSPILSASNSLTVLDDSLILEPSPILSASNSLTSLDDSLILEPSPILSASNSLTSLTDSLKLEPSPILSYRDSLTKFTEPLEFIESKKNNWDFLSDKITDAIKITQPYLTTKSLIEKSVLLDDSINPPFIFNNTDSVLHNLIQPEIFGKNIVLHNSSNFNNIDPIKYNLEELASNLEKYSSTTFLLDSNVLTSNHDNIHGYIETTMNYLSENNIDDFENKSDNVISISEQGAELINTARGESIPLDDLQLVNDIVGIENITAKELASFFRFIKKYPMLALCDENNIGKKIYDAIHNNFDKNLIIEKELVFYKCRKYDIPTEQMPYTEDDLYLAPYGKPGRGRFNSPELNHLYLSTDLNITISEVSAVKNDKIAILKCSPKRELKLFDLTKGNYCLRDFCLKKTTSDTKSEYIIPNYFSCCCRKAGYDGIKYNSVKNANCINYVLFEHNTENFNTIDILDFYIVDNNNSTIILKDEDGKYIEPYDLEEN